VSFRFLARPKWIAWTLVVVVAVVVMANLSLWQVNRLDERRDTNEAIITRTSEPVLDIDDPAVASLPADELQYRRIAATGTYLRGDDGSGAPLEVLVANQTFGGAPGWWVVTPLRTVGGTVVLVNRGWVPFASAVPGDSLESVAPPPGEVTAPSCCSFNSAA
jgi:cytochrome oxidase assembly protein ShyY1